MKKSLPKLETDRPNMDVACMRTPFFVSYNSHLDATPGFVMYFTGFAQLVELGTQDGKDVDTIDSSECADKYSLDLYGKDKKSIFSHPFHGASNQQWIVNVSGHSKHRVTIQSKLNKRFVGIQKRALDACLISTNSPYYWEMLKDGSGYKFVVPKSRLSLSLGSSAKLRYINEEEGTRLYRHSSSEANKEMLKRGEIGLLRKDNVVASSRGQVEDSLKVLQEFFASKDVKTVLTMLPTLNMSDSSKPQRRQNHLVTSQSNTNPTRCPGAADIVAVNDSGVTIIRNTAHPTKRVVQTEFASLEWTFGRTIRRSADTIGNGFADIVGFGETGTFVALNKGDNTFGPVRKVSSGFSYEEGWRFDKHIRFMGDLCNSGRADVVAFGDAGVHVSLRNGDGTYGPTKIAVKDFGYDQGWRRDKHLRLLADMDGNGSLDIVGFGEEHVWIARGNGDGTFEPPQAVFSDITYNKEWRCDQHPRFLADMTGDGKLDLVGFGNDGVHVSFNAGRGHLLPLQLVSPQFGDNSGYRMHETRQFVADLTGNGRGDLLAIGKTGIFVALNNGHGSLSSGAKRVSTYFCVDAGWSSTARNPRMLVDMTGDGRPDIVGIGSNPILVLYNDGSGNFTRKEKLIDGIGSQEPEWTRSLILAANLTPA